MNTGPDATLLSNPIEVNPIYYTKWYEIWKRHELHEFKTEGVVLILIVLFAIVHVWGTRVNRKKAEQFAKNYGPSMREQFAHTGFGPKALSVEDAEGAGLARAADNQRPWELMREKSVSTYISYATGRINVAFLDVEINLVKRYNPFMLAIEYIGSFLMESIDPPMENLSCVLYPFDGKETKTVPGLLPGTEELLKNQKSTYDNFVWAIVNKDRMKALRNDRYDLSITVTKDNAKLPEWATVMSEAHEITETMLTPELCAAVEKAGEGFEYLIISDQPIDQPTELNHCVPKKRLFLSMDVPETDEQYQATLPLFNYFLNLSDMLVAKAHFRPEVMKKVHMPRNAMITKLQKDADTEKIEERTLERERLKKQKRDAELNALSPKEQKKYLQKEKEREMKKGMKKQTVKG